MAIASCRRERLRKPTPRPTRIVEPLCEECYRAAMDKVARADRRARYRKFQAKAGCPTGGQAARAGRAGGAGRRAARRRSGERPAGGRRAAGRAARPRSISEELLQEARRL